MPLFKVADTEEERSVVVERWQAAETDFSLPLAVPLQVISLKGAVDERRLPADLIKEIENVPPQKWLAFSEEGLDSFPYAADLLRRLASLRRNWIGRTSLGVLEKTSLLELLRRSHCRALIFDGGEISAHYLTTLAPSSPELLHHLTDLLRRLPECGILSATRFVFGLDTDDEGVFERTARFCHRAKVGLPHFSVLTPVPGSTLFSTLEKEGRILHRNWQEYDGSHVVFQPKLMTPEALQNGLYWTRREWHSHMAIWRRSFLPLSSSLFRLMTSYAQRRLFIREPRGYYTEAMQLLSRFAQPIRVRERVAFISTLRGAVDETRRQLKGAWLKTQAIRDERLKALTIRLEGVLDLRGAKELLRRIHQAVRAGHQKIVLDFNGLESVSQTVITRFLEENAQTLAALRGRVSFRHLRTALETAKMNLGGALPNAHLLELAPEEP